MFNHGINIIGLWIVVELIERQFGTRKMSELGGLAQKAPALAILLVIVALCVRTPLVNAAVVIGAPTNVPVDVSTALLPLPSKLVTVLLLASWAVIVMLKDEPAVVVEGAAILKCAKTSAIGVTVALFPA